MFNFHLDGDFGHGLVVRNAMSFSINLFSWILVKIFHNITLCHRRASNWAKSVVLFFDIDIPKIMNAIYFETYWNGIPYTCLNLGFCIYFYGPPLLKGDSDSGLVKINVMFVFFILLHYLNLGLWISAWPPSVFYGERNKEKSLCPKCLTVIAIPTC